VDRENRLEALGVEASKRGLPPRSLEFCQRLFHAQSQAEARIGAVKTSLNDENTNERLEKGQPLLTFEGLALDWPLVQDTFTRVMAIFADFPDLLGELPANFTRTLTAELAKAWFEKGRLPDALVGADADGHLLLQAAIYATLKPFLSVPARSFISRIDLERWRRGYCPICGGWPDFALLDRERGSRWLVCPRCDSSWPFQRLQCPYCGNQDHSFLAYFADDTGLYRLYVCDQCHKYIKAIDLRQTQSDIHVELERLSTLDMDHQAKEKGYSPGHLDTPVPA
jgi:FdhE protein